MKVKFQNREAIEEFHQMRNIFGWFKKKKAVVRQGAMEPDTVKKMVAEIGVDKIVEIIRIGYDGEIDDMPLIVRILDISEDYFSGNVVNPERSIIEDSTRRTIYAKKGGGHVEFQYDDGDIYEIILSKDEDVLNEAKNINDLRDIILAMDENDPVLICYWDKSSRGTVNALGNLISKDESGINFSVQIQSINNIEFEEKKSIEFNLERDLVVDIQYAG